LRLSQDCLSCDVADVGDIIAALIGISRGKGKSGMEEKKRWTNHSRMSDPIHHRALMAELPNEIGRLNDIIQGVLVHADWAEEYGLDQTRLDASARKTLPIAERFDDVFARDPQPLHCRRPAERRSTGTCRDFALALSSILRSKNVPARVRCGFASYFSAGWEDHWVCEYWNAATRRWHLSDAQIDRMLKEKKQIKFNPADVPRDHFMPAGEAWLKCRRETVDPQAFGHGEVNGLWFVKINVVRDHYVLNGRETSDWDRWREAHSSQRLVLQQELPLLDTLASDPAQDLIEVLPDWLV
jgi:hypothetical protein